MSENVEVIRSTAVHAMTAEKPKPVEKTKPVEKPRAPKHSLFGIVALASTSRMVYDIKGGGKGATAIVAKVPIGKVTLEINIGAKYNPTTGLLTTEASTPRGVTFESEALADELLAYIERSAESWIGYKDAIDAAERKIAAAYGVKPKGTDSAASRPRLVRAVKMSAPAVS